MGQRHYQNPTKKIRITLQYTKLQYSQEATGTAKT